MADAWGKVLLFGEHSVVYGRPAVAVGVSPGTQAVARVSDDETVCIAPWGLTLGRKMEHKIADSVRVLCANLPFDTDRLSVDVTTHLPAGAGMGSSASLLVAVARAFADVRDVRLDDATLFDAVMAAEGVFHGTPSGLDHAAAMYGGALRFVRGRPPQMTPLAVGASIWLVVFQVAAGGDTGRLVGGVRERLGRHPSLEAPLLDAFGAVADAGVEALGAGDHARLGELMDINHGLLVALGVSTPALCAGCAEARAAGALGAKLTGAGGGGCLIALAPGPSEAEAMVAKVARSDYAARVVHVPQTDVRHA